MADHRRSKLLRMSDGRRLELQRLSEFKRGVPHVSGRAFTGILEYIKDNGMPDVISRRHQQEARDLTVCGVTPYGPIMNTVNMAAADGGTAIPLEIVNPLALLYNACADDGAFVSFFKERLALYPPRQQAPWRIALYTDGITPGDAFRTNNQRKVDACYFSFVEFGGAALAHEDAWFTLVSKRTVETSSVAGQLSKVVCECVKSFFGPIHNMRTSGIMLMFKDGTSTMLWADLDICVQDAMAHQQTWCSKAPLGHRSCMLCIDYVEPGSELAEFDPRGVLRTHIMRPRELRLHTDESLRAVLHRLRHIAAVQPATLEGKETKLGFRHEPNNILLDETLFERVRPMAQYQHDWMHVIMIGVYNIVMYLVLEVLRPRFHYDVIDAYMKQWRWPTRLGGHGNCCRSIFDLKHETPSRKNKSHKCTASEALSAIPVVAHFLRRLIPRCNPDEIAAINVFLAIVFVIELLQNIPRGTVNPDALEVAIENFMVLFVMTFGWEHTVPKFHSLLHLPHQYRQNGTLLNCWVHERKHKTIKRYAQHIMSGAAYEQSLLSEVTAHHVFALRKSNAFIRTKGLIPPMRAVPQRIRDELIDILGGNHVQEAFESRFEAFSTCTRGDVVIMDTGTGPLRYAGEILGHFDIDGVPVSIINTWEPIEAHDTYCTWQWRMHPELWSTVDILVNVISTRCGDVVTTLLPRR